MDIFKEALLPQHDPAIQDRRQELENNRKEFFYDFSVVNNVPISGQVPEKAKAGPGWSLQIIKSSYKLRRNWERIQKEHDYTFEKPLPHKSIGEIAKLLTQQDLLGILGYSDPDLGVALTDKRPESFNDYFKLFKQVDIPEGSEKIHDDADFADYFVSGLNPLMISLMKEVPQKLSLTNDQLAMNKHFMTDTISEMVNDERLFIVDYEFLSNLEAGSHPDQNKHIYAPIVVLGIPKNSKNLEVIAIQYGQDPEIYPSVTADSGHWEWLIAKTIVKISDANFHEVVSHLGLTHLVIEPIVIATFRNLAASHPLRELLAPHFEGTIPINALAVRKLINAGGKVEQLLSPKIESAYKVIEIVRNNFNFQEAALPKTLNKRGVGSSSKITNYPYRDDALLLWNAIQSWVGDFVNLHYSGNIEVKADTELQMWAEEIESPTHGRINGFLPEGGLRTRKQLVDILTMIIFTASAQHAAVNFPQGKAAAVPYQPLAGYAPAPQSTGLNENDALAFLPPRDRAIKQVHTLTLLGDTYYTRLGHYNLGTFSNKRVVPKLWKFQYRLNRIEKEIDSRNKQRRTPYSYLKPSAIPQSINI
ncbi:MAG: lipoxygenase [Pseudobacteriovorax sp.]|nr:lipoxygenase [Pseudobacteriovorax sp.]